MDGELMSQMDLAMRVSSLGRAARSVSGIKLRQPLAKATVVADNATLEKLRGLKDVVADELNVKELELASDAEEVQLYEVRLLPCVGSEVREAPAQDPRGGSEVGDR